MNVLADIHFDAENGDDHETGQPFWHLSDPQVGSVGFERGVEMGLMGGREDKIKRRAVRGTGKWEGRNEEGEQDRWWERAHYWP
ncbi:hypothetical protein LTR95_000591 [Oleoguttula sp. CCFEE 5521]